MKDFCRFVHEWPIRRRTRVQQLLLYKAAVKISQTPANMLNLVVRKPTA